MLSNDFNNAFKKLEALTEADFNLSASSKDEINDFLNNDIEDYTDVEVVDLDAESTEELEDDNVGRIILQCPCCETVLMKKKEDVELPENCDDTEDCLVQIGDQCPVCFSEEGFKIVGKVAPYEEVTVEITPHENKKYNESYDIDSDANLTDYPASIDQEQLRQLLSDTIEAGEDFIPVEKIEELLYDHSNAYDEEYLCDRTDCNKTSHKRIKEGILGAAGSIVGGALGGPVGALAGNALGNCAGKAASAISGKNQNAAENTNANEYVNTDSKYASAKQSQKRFNQDRKGSVNEGALGTGGTLAGGGIGAAIGGALGGPIGALAGGAIGAGVGKMATALPDKTIDTVGNAVDNISKNTSVGDAASLLASYDPKDKSNRRSQVNEGADEINAILARKDEQLHEGLNDVQLDTDTDHISIHAEKKNNGDEMIAPLDFEDANEIVDSQEEYPEDSEYLNDIETEADSDIDINDSAEDVDMSADISDDNADIDQDESDVDVDIDDVDEEKFDKLGESYLKEVYDNVKSYKTESIYEKNGKIVCEGLITFTSGNKGKTQFILEGNRFDKHGNCDMLVENAQITPGKKAMNISGKICGSKFIAESLNYKYRQNNATVKGTVKLH